jgi:hypothetical protein
MQGGSMKSRELNGYDANGTFWIIGVNFLKNEKAAWITLEQITSVGRKGIIVQADVSRADDISTIIQTLEKELGTIHRPDPFPKRRALFQVKKPLLVRQPKLEH